MCFYTQAPVDFRWYLWYHKSSHTLATLGWALRLRFFSTAPRHHVLLAELVNLSTTVSSDIKCNRCTLCTRDILMMLRGVGVKNDDERWTCVVWWQMWWQICKTRLAAVDSWNLRWKRRQQNRSEQSILTSEKTTTAAYAEILNGAAVPSLRCVLLWT